MASARQEAAALPGRDRARLLRQVMRARAYVIRAMRRAGRTPADIQAETGWTATQQLYALRQHSPGRG